MPALGPVSRRDLIHDLRTPGFAGPYQGTKHQIMQRDTITVRIPNPHRGDISLPLLRCVLDQAGVTVQEWEAE
jgi:hypothetical protein